MGGFRHTHLDIFIKSSRTIGKKTHNWQFREKEKGKKKLGRIKSRIVEVILFIFIIVGSFGWAFTFNAMCLAFFFVSRYNIVTVFNLTVTTIFILTVDKRTTYPNMFIIELVMTKCYLI